jgi:hypothetical protein
MKLKLSGDDCKAAMRDGEIPASLIASAPGVAVVLTQSWCPQWLWMKSYLGSVAEEEGVDVYWVEYDREPYFEEFRAFKEDTFGNYEIPYVRYYRDGTFARESNYIDKGGFLRCLKR